MKTIGEILKKSRLEQGLTLTEISQKTRISLKYLTAIEASDFKSLPPAAFTKGFIQNFAKALDLNPNNALAIFRRDYDQDERGHIVPRGLTEPVKAPVNWFTPTTTTLALSALIGLFILTFFVRQIIQFNAAPPLEILSPGENESVSSPLTVTGKTHPQSTVTVNNRAVTVNDTGEFQTQLTLPPGKHTLVVTTTSRSDKERTHTRSITVLP